MSRKVRRNNICYLCQFQSVFISDYLQEVQKLIQQLAFENKKIQRDSLKMYLFHFKN